MPLLVDISKNAGPILGLVVGLYIINKIYVFYRLREFKGPFWAGFSDWPHSNAMLRGNCDEWYAEVNEKHGPVARIAPNILITSSPEVFAHMNIKPNYKRADWFYKAIRIEYRRDNVFSQTDNEKHDMRRKQMAPGYSGRENFDLEPAIDILLQRLLDLIRSKYTSSDAKIVPMDLGAKIQYFTLDVISSVGFGKEFGMLRNDADVSDYIKSADNGLTLCNIALALGFSGLAQTPFIGKFITPSAGDKKGYGKLIATVFRSVDERAANPSDKRSDMLASFMRHGIVGDELRSEALEQVIAGSDTTATGLRGIFLHLMTNPRVYSKLQHEIDEAMTGGLAPALGQGLISIAQTKQLPYLQAVIREGLRLFVPVSGILPREVPPGGDTLVINGESVFLPGEYPSGPP
ncbi:Cytochrome P450 monooxygenase ABA1 [Cladobotryum mycophilum]|uniref:Cytochrome P450 monooxygenase ABA1 n=1 Tax=Cladobotryum mycophilum TaxID=491253 RepID=A0ABR0SRA9_9HYPO